MKKLRICFTTDTHGYVFPTNFYSKTENNLPMGLLKCAAAFCKDENTLIIDGGDTLQGSPFTYLLAKSSAGAYAQTMNRMGYDYVTLGNHDFNYGNAYLQSYLDALQAKCLCANIRHKESKLPIISQCVHTMPNGLRVGIVGVCTHHITKWEKQETLAELHIQNPLETLRTMGNIWEIPVDVRVCIYHGGFECDVQTGKILTDSDENQAYAIAKEFGFDILLTGHQHISLANHTIGHTHVVQNNCNAPHFCEVNLEWDNGVQHITSKHVAPAQRYDAWVAEPVLPYYSQVEQWLDKPLCTLSVPLVANAPLHNAVHGSLICNFVNQIQLFEGKCMLSACSLANEVKGLNQNVSVRDVVSTYVYSNTLCVLELTGAQLKQYMEKTASYFALQNGEPTVSEDFLLPKVAHYNYDYFYGLDYAFDIRKPVGERVVKMDYQGKAIVPTQKVSIIVNSYRASGTGGYDMLVGVPMLQDIQKEVSGLIIERLEQTDTFTVDEKIPFTVIY